MSYDKILTMIFESSCKSNSSQEKQNVTTVLLADDHPLVLKALKSELEKEPDFKVIAEANNGEEAIRLATELSPDVVIMDIGMPKLNGIEATRKIKTVCPNMIVLVLTVYDDAEHILGVLEAGADGYLTKNVLGEQIVQAVRSIIAGEAVLTSQAFQQVLKYAVRHAIKPVLLDTGIKLTPRELEVIKLVASGMSNKNIAEELNLSLHTIKSHLFDIFSKLKVFSRTEMVIHALRAGLIKLNDFD
jgi:DNA-binding NarL/FixJ family response regulator